MTTANEFVSSVNLWAGVKMEWTESDIVWSGARDNGEILEYLKGLIRKIEKAQAEHVACMMEGYENLEG